MKRYACLVIFLFFSFDAYTQVPFATLMQAQLYAENHEEYPPIDGTDWMDPDYTRYERSLTPGWFERVRIAVGWKKTNWSAKKFKNQLEQIVKQRELQGYEGRFVELLKPAPGDTFVIWGDLYGAFHSLVRDLESLKSKGILDDDFTIKNKSYYFVFNGNVINRSAYILETLSVVMRLMHTNPDRVFYIRGDHEDKHKWHNYGLKRQLEIRAASASNEKVPLSSLVSKFFDTLPLALYLKEPATDNKKPRFVRISFFDRQFLELDEGQFSDFLATKKQKPPLIKRLMKKNGMPEQKIAIPLIIKGINRELILKETEGLTRLDPDKGSTAWTILSAPTSTFRREYLFFHDAYAELKVAPSIDDWTITLFHQDVREKSGFIKAVTFKALSGVELEKDVKIKAKEEDKIQRVFFGSTLDLSKGTRIVGTRISNTLYTLFRLQQVQRKEAGFVPEIIIFDDEYNPIKARQNVLQFISEFGVDKLIFPVGTPTTQAYLDLIKNKQLAIFFPLTAASIFRTPDLKNVINFGVSSLDEGFILTHYMIKKYNLKRFVFFYQNDQSGLNLLQGAKKALSQAGVTNWTEISYEANETDFETQAKKVIESNADAVGFFATSIASKVLIRQIGVENLINKQLFGNSDLGEDIFKSFIKNRGLHFTISNQVPDPKYSTLPLVQKYREVAQKNNLRIGPFVLQVFIGVSLLFDRMKTITGLITKENLIESFEQIKEYNFGGLTLNFDPKTRSLLHSVWLDTGKTEWIEVPIKKHLEEIVH